MKTADLSDAYPGELVFCDRPFRSFGQRTSFAGPVQTVACFEDNSAVRAELEQPGGARILIVDGGASSRVALMGDILVDLSIRNGWGGVVLNCAIRDSAEIADMDQAVFALGTSPIKSNKRGWGKAGLTLNIGGARISPGMFAYGDADGVLLSDQGDLRE